MEKVIPRIKWHWFLTPLPISSVWAAVSIACIIILHPDISSRVVLYGLFCYIGITYGWWLLALVVRRKDMKEVVPHIYFSIFWIIILIMELIVLAMCYYLGIGQFQTFGFR